MTGSHAILTFAQGERYSCRERAVALPAAQLALSSLAWSKPCPTVQPTIVMPSRQGVVLAVAKEIPPVGRGQPVRVSAQPSWVGKPAAQCLDRARKHPPTERAQPGTAWRRPRKRLLERGANSHPFPCPAEWGVQQEGA